MTKEPNDWRKDAPPSTPAIQKELPEPAAAGIPEPGAAPSDHTLLALLRGGDQEGATQLHARYVHRLRALVRANCSSKLAARLDADDVVQSVFRSFFRGAGAGVYDVPAGQDLWRLLLTIALNKVRAQGVFHHAAKRDVRQTCSLSLTDSALEPSAPQDELAEMFLHMFLEEALARLPEQHRAMMELRLQGHNVAVIARQSGRSKRTVERVLQQALAQLQTLYGQEA